MQAKAKPQEENVLKLSNIAFTVFTHSREKFWSKETHSERTCAKSYRPLHHGNGVTIFRRLRTCRAIVPCGNELAVNACMGSNGNPVGLHLQTKAPHYFIHWFDVTNFCEHNKKPNNVIFNGDTS